jgi:predicted 2-oxoglutarate/Fe(II)-dependent dioxygenase YbiX
LSADDIALSSDEQMSRVADFTIRSQYLFDGVNLPWIKMSFPVDELAAKMASSDAGIDSTCLAIGPNLKIAKRIDHLSRPIALADLKESLHSGILLQDAGEAIVPVLRIPNVLSPEFCGELIAYFDESVDKKQSSSGLSAPGLDLSLKRATHVNCDRLIAQAIDERFVFSLLPAVERIYDYRVSHRTAYKITSYEADQSGFFGAHRDNSDPGTVFRRFALTVALNDEWGGAGICFPEYSDSSFKLCTGDAIVFPVSLLHRVGPVRAGRRVVLVSMLYDKAAARMRRETMPNPEILDGVFNDRIADEILCAYEDFAPLPRFCPQYDIGQVPAAVASLQKKMGSPTD